MISSILSVTTSTSAGPGWAKARSRAGRTSAESSTRMPRMPMALAMAAKIRILQVGAHIQEARRLHLHVHEAEQAVVEHDDLHRQVELAQGEDVAHEHAEDAIARERNHLPAGIGALRADGLRHGIGHGAVDERAEQSPLAVHLHIARRQDRGLAHVAGEDGIVRRHLVHHLRQILRGEWPCPWRRARRARPDPCARRHNASAWLRGSSHRCAASERAAALERELHVAHETEIEPAGAAAEIFGRMSICATLASVG